MKKRLFGLITVGVFTLCLCGCNFTKYYDMYFHNKTVYTVNGWGCIDCDTGDVYQSEKNSINTVYPGYENGPLELEEKTHVYIDFKFLGSDVQYSTRPNYYIVDRDFTFYIYNDLTYDAYERSALGDNSNETGLYIVDNNGNKYPLTPVENSDEEIRAF